MTSTKIKTIKIESVWIDRSDNSSLSNNFILRMHLNARNNLFIYFRRTRQYRIMNSNKTHLNIFQQNIFGTTSDFCSVFSSAASKVIAGRWVWIVNFFKVLAILPLQEREIKNLEEKCYKRKRMSFMHSLIWL